MNFLSSERVSDVTYFVAGTITILQPSVSSKAGHNIPVLVTTRIASVGHLLAHAPMKSHFSTSLPIPSASTGAPSPHSTSISNASTGQSFTHKPHAAQTLGIATVKLALFAEMKSPGQASIQVLHPIHLAELMETHIGETIPYVKLNEESLEYYYDEDSEFAYSIAGDIGETIAEEIGYENTYVFRRRIFILL